MCEAYDFSLGTFKCLIVEQDWKLIEGSRGGFDFFCLWIVGFRVGVVCTVGKGRFDDFEETLVNRFDGMIVVVVVVVSLKFKFH